MGEPQTEWLHDLMKRLARAVHGGVVQSGEVQRCLQELHRAGWDAVMLLEASVVFRENGEPLSDEAFLHVHADPRPRRAEYRLSPDDVAWLTSLGISPTRYRSVSSRPTSPPPHDDSADR
ncbi:MAG TPA: hypothetical protein ENK19_10725 [Acidobacteria bacterium]|nr:hypothetical protein [Acidobacteriota bacterium]